MATRARGSATFDFGFIPGLWYSILLAFGAFVISVAAGRRAAFWLQLLAAGRCVGGLLGLRFGCLTSAAREIMVRESVDLCLVWG